MVKKKNKNSPMYWILGVIAVILLIAVIIFFYGGKQGWFKSTISVIPSTTIIESLENPIPTGIACSLSLSKSVITSGDFITGTIRDGRNAYCEGFGKIVGTTDWRKTSEGTTDLSGIATHSENFWVVGDFIFAAICDTNGNGYLDAQDCVTNEVSLKVNPGVDSTCVDSDNKNKMTPGWVTLDSLSYYDDCAGDWAVKEYWCNGNVLAESVIGCDPGYICTETRSGDYCGLIAEDSYDVGDNVGNGISNSLTGNFGEVFITPITMGWTTGGPYILGARITRNWNYADPQCEPNLPQQYPMEWTFYDSNGMAWQKYDYVEVNNVVDTVCPVTYHEDAPWKFVVSVGIQDCPVEYSWNVQPYICEVNQ